MPANSVILLFNGLTLALALTMLLLTLWQDASTPSNQIFALFLFSVLIWASGSLLARAAAYVNAGDSSVQLGLVLLDIGFMSASITIYVYSAVITSIRGHWFQITAVAGFVLIAAYQSLLLITETPRAFEITSTGLLNYQLDAPASIIYLIFLLSTVLLVWQNRRKIRAQTLRLGILLFATAQLLSLISPHFRARGTPEEIGSIATLLISYAVVRQQIMVPLLGRARQVEAVRDVGLAITSRLNLEDTLSAIAAQAASLLDADGVAIFLKREQALEVAAVYELPAAYLGITVPIGTGLAGTVAAEQRGRRLDDFRRDWHGEADLPLAREAFGAVLCVPLMFADDVVGVLLVIAGRQGRLFDREDMRLLQLLGPQAAVAITNSRLFEAERKLSRDLVAAKDQVETILTSTENPVVAFDRKFRVLVANPAAMKLFKRPEASDAAGEYLVTLVPNDLLPHDPRKALHALWRHRAYTYDISTQGRSYLCHIAELGRRRGEGWVAVVNDVSELKELDRLKSQMIQMTSHDLKNPLQAAMSYMELLAEDGEAVMTDDMRDDMAVVWTQLNRMYRIISGILDLERVRSGTPAFEACDLEQVLKRTVDELADQVRAKGLELDLTLPESLPLVLGDTQQLGQAVINLIENAIKFTPSGGHIDLRAEASASWVEISVRDTGIGIVDEELNRVFERFFRGQQRGLTNAGGSGLGLSLVKAVVERHNGKIELNSAVGVGTTVTIHLPVADSVEMNKEQP
ncbi:MAG TPA: ATP-binding protein [Aggregatilinea sp.]|uniref:ATP-binding protein n=1 Tax=Aggregatilinea sp. TaxID=2806333 RepID=UPI002CEADC60|nr:ATP-binding protein [Aggregatilinea sp.]HML20141.1 ATP-binding protein [Aggregatilinea sp.]